MVEVGSEPRQSPHVILHCTILFHIIKKYYTFFFLIKKEKIIFGVVVDTLAWSSYNGVEKNQNMYL